MLPRAMLDPRALAPGNFQVIEDRRPVYRGVQITTTNMVEIMRYLRADGFSFSPATEPFGPRGITFVFVGEREDLYADENSWIVSGPSLPQYLVVSDDEYRERFQLLPEDGS
jgi:hypothetical protein